MGKIRRSLLFIPGNSPGMLLNGAVFGVDSLIFDLEDAISPNEKDAARILVRNALRELDYNHAEKIIRINSLDTPYWHKDLQEVIPAAPDAILLPKVQGKEDIAEAVSFIENIEDNSNITRKTEVIPLIESAMGIERAFEIATASRRITALFLGAEDLTADLGAIRSSDGKEIFYCRSRIVVAAKAAGIPAIDTPFTDINDEQGLIADITFAKEMGFNGKAAIFPRHIEHINKIFTPSKDEIEYAQRVMAVIEKAKKEGRGVIALDGKMIDAPIAARAQQVLKLAEGTKGVK